MAVNDGIADQRLMILLHIGDVAQRQERALLVPERHLGHVGGLDDRQEMTDAETLVRGVDPAAGADVMAAGVGQKPGISESAVVSMTLSRLTCLALSLWGSTCTCSIFSRSPQIATLATPGTRSSRSSIFQ